MANLYQLTNDYKTVLNMLYDEDVDEQMILDTLEGIEGEIEYKADNYARIIKELLGDAEKIKKEKLRLEERQKAFENRAKLLKDNLQNTMIQLEKKKFKMEILSYQEGEEAGIKSVSFLVKGTNAYGYLKNEKGVHRLVRLSPFDSNNRRHTSFASVEVTPEIEQDNSIEIDDKDLKVDVYRSTGAGGQGVNTTDSAVRITHLPTKIVVTCQNERSQIQNKEQALKVLKNKLLLKKLEEQEQELNQIKGNQMNIEFGSQIRSYVMHPYSMVKDHRTNVETSNVSKVLDGDIDLFIESNLKKGL